MSTGRRSVRALIAACAGISAVIGAPRSARAEPQWNAGVAAGVAGTGSDFGWSATKFYGALRGELLFGHYRGVEVGPALEVGTIAFSDARFGAGATILVPVDGVLALSVTPGGYVRTGFGDTAPGVSGRVFFGAHPFNRVGPYALAAGIVAGVDRDLAASHASAFVVGAQLDAAAIALPFILLYEWLRGPPD